MRRWGITVNKQNEKVFFLFLAMAISFLGTVHCNAQLFDGSVHFNIKGGEALTANTEVEILYFNTYEEKVYYTKVKKNAVSQHLQNDRYYYRVENNKFRSSLSGKYQPSISTSSRDVYGGRGFTVSAYSGRLYADPADYYTYYGFAKDKSSYVFWREDLDGNILNKTYYIEVSIEDLLPKTVNRDFLYE